MQRKFDENDLWCRYLVDQIIQFVISLFVTNDHIFRHLKLEIALEILATYEKNYQKTI